MALASSSGLWGRRATSKNPSKSATRGRGPRNAKTRAPFLSARIKVFLRNSALKFIGGICLALATLTALAFASWHAGDPSFNSVPLQGYQTQNWLGVYGSYPADGLIQLFGRTIPFLLTLTLAIWGLRLMTRHRIGWLAVRGLCLLLALFLGALALGAATTIETLGLPTPIAWLAQVHNAWLHGGMIGTINPWLTELMQAQLVWLPSASVSVVAGLAGFCLALVALTFSPVRLGRAIARAIGQATYYLVAWTSAYFRDLVREGVRAAFANLRAKFVAVQEARRLRQATRTETRTSKPPLLRRVVQVFNPLAWVRQLRRLVAFLFVPLRALMRLNPAALNLRGQQALLPKGKAQAVRVEPQLGSTPALGTTSTIQPAPEATPEATLDQPESTIEIRGPHRTQAEKSAGILARNRRRDTGGYALPQVELLREVSSYGAAPDPALVREEAERLTKVLREFGVQGEVVRTHFGPHRHPLRASPRPRH